MIKIGITVKSLTVKKEDFNAIMKKVVPEHVYLKLAEGWFLSLSKD